jgi:dihydropyrimidinase
MTLPRWCVSGPGKLETLEAIVAAGVPSFKVYLAYEGLRLNDRELYRAMQAIARAGGLAVAHCENGPVCDELRAQAIARGHKEPIYHALTRPPLQEAEATGRAIDIAALAGCPLYVVHVSCAESLQRLRAARSQGRNVCGETCPQYLLLSQEALAAADGELLICAPPLRPAENQDALWHALARGDLDVLATDHCPFMQMDKQDHPDFTTIPGGLPSIEARLTLAHTFGHGRGLGLERWVEVCCTNPARIFGLQRKGVLAPGYDADVVVFDPTHTLRLSAGRTLHEHVDWSPYEGQTVHGSVRDVLSRGRIVVRDRQFVGQPGYGRFVARTVSGGTSREAH